MQQQDLKTSIKLAICGYIHNNGDRHEIPKLLKDIAEEQEKINTFEDYKTR